VPVLIGLLLLARLIGMAVVPLMDTTEARYGETGRIMAELNDWITPWFDYGVPFWGKPPLAFWVTAASFKAFGVSEFTARLPHLAISVFIVGLAAWLAARRDRDAALPTVALMTGSFLSFISAAVVMIDIELILGTTLAMAGFWLALEAPDSLSTGGVAIHSRAIAGSLFFGGIILGLLAKGPIALVMAGIPTLCWTAYNRRWLDVWRRLPWLAGIALTLLLALPWYGIAEHRTPGFLEYFLVGEHWHRYLTPGWTGDRYGNPHYFPIGTIWGFAVVDTLPWSLLLPFAAWGWRKEIKASAQAIMGKAANGVAAGPGLAANKADGAVGAAGFIGSDVRVWQGYLLIWALTPLLFFTLAQYHAALRAAGAPGGRHFGRRLAGATTSARVSDRPLARQRPVDHAGGDVRLGTAEPQPARQDGVQVSQGDVGGVRSCQSPADACARGQFARLGANAIRCAIVFHLGPSVLGPVLQSRTGHQGGHRR